MTICELPATIMTTPLDSATAISCNRRKFWQSKSVNGRFGPFFFAHAHNRHYLCFRSEICYHYRSQRHRFPVKGWNFCDLTTFQIFFSYILLRMRRNSHFWACLRLQFWQSHWIQRLRFPLGDGNFGNRKTFTAVLGHFSLRMRRIGIIYAYGPKSVITVVLSDIDFL